MAKAIGLFTDNIDELKTWYETSGKNKPIQDLFPGFVYAVENQNIETAKFFIVNGVDVNQVYAINESIVDRSNFDMLTLLFDSGLQIDFQSDFGKELLANKAAVADIDSARLLIQHGADVNAYTECGGTALLESCFMTFKAKHMKMIQFLLENGANPNICYSSSSLGSPLHRVCQKGSLEAVKLLVEYGADLNYKETRNDRHGYYKDSALLAAAKENHLDIVKYLVEHGADVHIPDGFGFSLLDVSKSPEMREYVKTVFIVEPLTYAFPDVKCFDEINQEEILVKDFMKNEEQILIRFGETLKAYNRYELHSHYNKGYTLYDNSVITMKSYQEILKTRNHFFVASYEKNECHLKAVEFEEFFV